MRESRDHMTPNVGLAFLKTPFLGLLRQDEIRGIAVRIEFELT